MNTADQRNALQLTRYARRVLDKSAPGLTRVSRSMRRQSFAVIERHWSSGMPLVSIIVPCYRSELRHLQLAVDSVMTQSAANWELVLVADGPSERSAESIAVPSHLQGKVKITSTAQQGGISSASNLGAEVASGEWLLFLDHDDVLDAFAVQVLTAASLERPDVDWFYSDAVKIHSDGTLESAIAKPPFDPILLMSYMYVGQTLFVRRALFLDLGGFDPRFDGAQDHDLALRAKDGGCSFEHVAAYLYSWRMQEGSTGRSAKAKPRAQGRGRSAVEESLERTGLSAQVSPANWAVDVGAAFYQLSFEGAEDPVTVAILTHDNHRGLRACVESLRRLTRYSNLRIRVMLDDSSPEGMYNFARSLDVDDVTVGDYRAGGRFSFSEKANRAVAQSETDLVVLMNDDVVALGEHWLEQMVGYSRFERVGAVGCQLLFPDGSIQHAGIVVGLDGRVTDHVAKGETPGPGYYGILSAAREVSAVTAAVMLVKKSVYEAVGGFDTGRFRLAYNDVDFGLRLSAHGFKSVLVPGVRFIHEEGATRSGKDWPDELHQHVLSAPRQDKHWGPNWDVSTTMPRAVTPPRSRVAGLAPQPTILWLVHDTSVGGATQVAVHLARRASQDGYKVKIMSPTGDLGSHSADENLEILAGPSSLATFDDHQSIEDKTARLVATMQSIGADLVVANTLLSAHAIDAAIRVGIPSIWHIHESEGLDFFRHYDPVIANEIAPRSLVDADRVVFVSNDSRAIYSAWDDSNHVVAHIGLIKSTGVAPRAKAGKSANSSCGMLLSNSTVFLMVGTICRRKGQDRLLTLLKFMEDRGQLLDTFFWIVGKIDPDFDEEFKSRLSSLDYYGDRVRVMTGVGDLRPYWLGADAFLMLSRTEGYPAVVMEALEAQLPILSTPTQGVNHILRHGLFGTIAPFDEGESGLVRWAEELSALCSPTERATRRQLSLMGFACLTPLEDFENRFSKFIDDLV